MQSGPTRRSFRRLFLLFAGPMLLAAALTAETRERMVPGIDPSQFPKPNPAFEIRLARIEKGDSAFELSEPLGIDTLGGGFEVLLPEGTRLPASYEERRFVETRETEAIQLHFRGAADEPGSEKRSIGLFVSDSLSITPGGLPHLTAHVAVDEAGVATVSVPSSSDKSATGIGTVRVRKAGPASR
jgi:hypothetical protein